MCCVVLSAALGQHFGFWHMMDAKDETKISWAIVIITAVASASIGYYSYKRSFSKQAMSVLWYISDAMITLGMIGTVAGFLIMMDGGFADIDATDPASIQGTIKVLGAGMGTILITTLIGLMASVLLKLELVVTEHEPQG